MNAIKASKTSLRKHMKSVLNGISDADKSSQSKTVTAKLLNSDVFKNSSRISVFLSMHDEINTDAIVEHCVTNGKQCFIPR